MATRAQKIRLGVFMLLSFLGLFGSVGVLAGLQLWNPRDLYFVRYRESVSGLEIGAAVKMKGVRVGRVEKIRVAEDAESVVVDLALDPKTPVTTDTRAVVAAIGITGLKFIELTGGTARSTKIEPNTKKSEIRPGESVLQTLTGKATDIATKMEAVLNNVLALTNTENRTRVAKLLDSTTRMTTEFGDLAKQNKRRVRRILANVDRATAALQAASRTLQRSAKEAAPAIKETLASASAAAKSVSRAVAGLRPQRTLNAINAAARALRKRIEDPSITKALAALRDAGSMVSGLSKDVSSLVSRSSRQVGSILSQLKSASRNFKAFSRAIRERPSLLLRGQTVKERKLK